MPYDKREWRAALGEPSTCYLCGQHIERTTATIDHIVPVSRGGSHDISNLRYACRTCNSMKADLMPLEFIAAAQRVLANAPDIRQLRPA